MTTVLYEHPLNERIRNYLKLEHLFTQVDHCSIKSIAINYQVFFNGLFAIIDTLERCDIRGDLIKDLEKLEQNLVLWSKSPQVDDATLQENLQESVSLIALLRSKNVSWVRLKEDKLLAGLKQRFAIQGGSSSFDLPQLQFWLFSSPKKIEQDVTFWLSRLNEIRKALNIVLKFIRKRAAFESIDTESGFYQDVGEGLMLLRIRVEQSLNIYPLVSGNKFRYSIRFMSPCEEVGKKYIHQATSFDLARC